MSITAFALPEPATESPLVPVYAAGAGMPNHALEKLRAAGWTRYEDGLGDVSYLSPDGTLAVEFGPETRRYQNDPGALWQATYTDPNPYTSPRRSWRAAFGDSVPAEAIAAFLTALCDPAGLDPDRDA